MAKKEFFYKLANAGDNKVLIVKTSDLSTYAIHDDFDHKLKFTPLDENGKLSIALINKSVKILKRPTAQQIHFEYMAHASRARFLGAKFEDSTIVTDYNLVESNMLTCEGTIEI